MSWPTTDTDKQLLRNADLTELQETVLRLRLADMSFRLIAHHLDLDESTVRGHYDRASRKLRRAKGALTSPPSA